MIHLSYVPKLFSWGWLGEWMEGILDHSQLMIVGLSLSRQVE